MTGSENWYTYKGAAERVGRSVRTIKRWAQEGMAMRSDNRGLSVVREDVLLEEYRRRLDLNTVHQRKRNESEDSPDSDGWT